jgi:regulation of enolase protein 1 (concanavalin A-like superfamily)
VTVVVGPAITPSDWIVEDMTPAVSIRGQTLLLNNVFTLTGTGAGYSNMTADAAHVMVRQVAGDGSVVARLNSLTGPTNRLAGVTIRDTLYRSATRAVLGYVPGSGLQFRTRTTVSATDSVTNQTGVTLPVWLRLDRNAATGAISAFYAPDVSGSPGTWNPVGVATVVTMDTNAVFGLTATSSSASSSAAATFDNVALTPDGDALITEDFGTSSPVAGTDGYTNGVYTIGGSGLLDSSGHFVGRPYVGDFVATVKLVNATSVATSAKSGLMIRESMDGGGYIFLGRIPTGSFDGYIWRTLAAGSSSGVPSFTASTRWIRLIRNGNKTTGFHAPDVSGAPGAWVQLGQPRTVIMTTPVLVGLAVDNAGGTGLNTCTFSNLTVVSLNKAPIVNPGTVAPYPLSPFALNGSVTDDSYPTPPAVTLLWSQRAGPGTVTFADATLTNTTASVSVSGDYTLRLQADDGSVQTFRDLTFTAYATAYDAWAGQQWAGTGGINDPNSISTADPDGDGIANLMEYALNLDPNVPGVIGLPVQGTTNVGGNDYLTLTYTRVKSATDISYVVEVSGDLVTWNSGPSYTATVSVTDNPDGITQTVVVRDLVPMGSATSRFIRLKITQP